MVKNAKSFIHFVIAYVLSAFGFEFLFFTLLLYVFNLTNRPLDVGIFTAISFFPRLFSPFYGSLVDRFHKQKVFALGTISIAALVLLLTLFKSIIAIYIIWFFLSGLFMLVMNVRTIIMTEVFSQDNYLWGNSTILILLNFSKLMAPLVGGFLSQIAGIRPLLIFAAGLYIMASIFGLLINIPEREKIKEDSVSPWQHVLEGLNYIMGSFNLKYLAIIAICWRLFLGMQTSLFIVYVKSYLSKGAAEYGVFMTLVGVGSLLGSILGPVLFKRLNEQFLMVAGLLIHYLLFMVLGIISNYQLALLIVVISYAVFSITLVGIHSLRDHSTTAEYRGRVYGSITAVLTPPAIISILVGSWLTQIFGVNLVFEFTGILAVISLVLTLAYYERKKRVLAEDNLPA